MNNKAPVLTLASRSLAIGLMVVGIVACDNSPNPGFQQAWEDGQTANQADPYAGLETAPPVMLYGWWKDSERASRASAEADRLKDVYRPLYERWQGEARGARIQSVSDHCGQAFGGALDYKGGAGTDPSATGRGPGEDVYIALSECRQSAIALEGQDGLGDEEQLQLAIIRRFSSSGMVLVGLGTVAGGHMEAGLVQWREGRSLLDEDKAGFKLSLQSLRGW